MHNPRVFISYPTRDIDREWMREFVDSLRALGTDVFYDADDIEPGANMVETIEEALRRSDCVVFFAPQKRSERANVYFDLGAAIGMGKRSLAVVPYGADPLEVGDSVETERLMQKSSAREAARKMHARLVQLMDQKGVEARNKEVT